METDQEIQLLARAGEAIQSDVTNISMGVVTRRSEEVHARYEQALDRDEKDEDFWIPAATTRLMTATLRRLPTHADQLAVRDLTQPSTPEFAHEEVYLRDISGSTLSGEARRPSRKWRAQEPEAEQESDRERDRRGFDIDEPF